MNQYEALRWATATARRGAVDGGCAKSSRGVVIFVRAETQPLAEGVNAPPGRFRCQADDACRETCAQRCVHAEQAALLQLGCHAMASFARGMAGTRDGSNWELEMLHAKLDVLHNNAVAGGPPSCPECSKLILAAGIRWVWLYEMGSGGPELRQYSAEDFHRISLENAGIAVPQK